MKVVLARTIEDYCRFLEKIYLRGKSVRGYRFIRNLQTIRGLSRDTQLVRLRGWDERPDADDIMEECRNRIQIPERIRTGNRRTRVGHGRTPGYQISDGVESYDDMWASSVRDTEGAVLTRELLEETRERVLRNANAGWATPVSTNWTFADDN